MSAPAAGLRVTVFWLPVAVVPVVDEDLRPSSRRDVEGRVGGAVVHQETRFTDSLGSSSYVRRSVRPRCRPASRRPLGGLRRRLGPRLGRVQSSAPAPAHPRRPPRTDRRARRARRAPSPPRTGAARSARAHGSARAHQRQRAGVTTSSSHRQTAARPRKSRKVRRVKNVRWVRSSIPRSPYSKRRRGARAAGEVRHVRTETMTTPRRQVPVESRTTREIERCSMTSP